MKSIERLYLKIVYKTVTQSAMIIRMLLIYSESICLVFALCYTVWSMGVAVVMGTIAGAASGCNLSCALYIE